MTKDQAHRPKAQPPAAKPKSPAKTETPKTKPVVFKDFASI